MSKICVTTNISMLIFASTCKQLPQLEPTEFSKNIERCNNYFFKIIKLKAKSYLYPVEQIHLSKENFFCDFTPFYAITTENILKSNILNRYTPKDWIKYPKFA